MKELPTPTKAEQETSIMGGFKFDDHLKAGEKPLFVRETAGQCRKKARIDDKKS